MKRLTPYYAYRIYVSIRAHFAGSYDITAYRWRFLRPDAERFRNSSTFGIFSILSYKIQNDAEWVNILIVALQRDRSISYMDLMDQYDWWKKESIKWQDHIRSISYIFTNEATETVKAMFGENKTFDGDFPDWLLKRFIAHKMCVETFIIFKKLLDFNLDGDPNYEYLYQNQYEKYELLINVSTEKYRTILANIIKQEKLCQ